MINKLKLGVYLTVLFTAFFGLAGSANAQSALVFSSATTVTLGGNSYAIGSTSEATSIVVNTTNVVVTVPDAKTIIFDSELGHTLSSDQTSATASCVGGISRLSYTSSGSTTITITPNSSTIVCPTSSGGGGGGGGGGSTKKKTIPATPAVPANTENPADCLPGYKFSPTTGRNCNAATPATPAVPSKGYAFGTILVKAGVKGEACRAWQMFLNDKMKAGLVVDGWCGKLSTTAAKSWQASVGLAPDGVLGPMSRAKANTQ